MRAFEIVPLSETQERALLERAQYVEVPKAFDRGDTHQIAIHQNPSSSGLLGLLNKSSYGNMRGLINGDDVYWWDSADALHAGVADALGLDPISYDHDEDEPNDPRRLILAKDGNGAYLDVAPAHQGHPRLARLKGQLGQ